MALNFLADERRLPLPATEGANAFFQIDGYDRIGKLCSECRVERMVGNGPAMHAAAAAR